MSFSLISRVVHFLSTGYLSGIIVYNYLFGSSEYLREEPLFSQLNITAGICIFVTGIANMIMLKKGKKLEDHHLPWKFALELKFTLALLLTPLVKPFMTMLVYQQFVEADSADDFQATMQFYLVVFIFLLSGFVKLYREEFCNNFELDPVAEKFHQITEKYH